MMRAGPSRVGTVHLTNAAGRAAAIRLPYRGRRMARRRQLGAAALRRAAREPLLSIGERELGVQGCARADRAVHGDRAAERLDPVFEPDEAGTPDRIAPAAPALTHPPPTGIAPPPPV